VKVKITLLPRAIRRELVRVGADALRVRNLGYGLAALEGTRPDAPFRWQGRARVILDRLETLPDGAGSQAVIAAFAHDARRGER
jgi:hypothetical protein